MIKIRTSYFTSPKVKDLIANWNVDNLISVSRKPPSNFPLKDKLPELAPTKVMIKLLKSGRITEEAFTELYIEKVEPVLDNIEFEDGAILLCYKPSNEFCHRIILGNSLRERNYEVEEL